MHRFVDDVIRRGASMALEGCVADPPPTGRANGQPRDPPLEDSVLPSMYTQFGDDVTLLHLSESIDAKGDQKGLQENARGTYTVCNPLVESVPSNAATAFKGSLSRLLPTYDTIARLVQERGATTPSPTTGIVAGHKRFYPAHFSSYYAYGVVTCCIAVAIDVVVWSSLAAIFALLAVCGILSTLVILWMTCLAMAAPKPVTNAPQPLSPLPSPSDWLASYLYHVLSIGTFGPLSPESGGAKSAGIPQHFALAFQYVADNVRPTESLLIAVAIVLGLMVLSACFNLGCSYALALAPNALHRQWQSNGNNSMSSVIAMGAHQVIRRYHQHSASIRAAGVRLGRQALIGMLILKLTINLFVEMDKQGMFPATKGPTAFVPHGSRGASDTAATTLVASAAALDALVTSAGAINRVVGFITAFALAFVSADFISSRLSNKLFMQGRIPFFVKCVAPAEKDEGKRTVAQTEMTSEFLTHAAVAPRLPDRLRFKPAVPAAEEGAEPAAPTVDVNAGRRMYHGCGVRPDVPAGPTDTAALDWLTDLAPFVLSSDAVALAECFRKLFAVVISTAWMLLFWRWPSTMPFGPTFKSLSSAVGVSNGPIVWLAGLWTGHNSVAKGIPAPAATSLLTPSTIVLGFVMGVALSTIMYARRATAPTARVAFKGAALGHTVDRRARPTAKTVIGQQASSETFLEYVSVWAAAQARPFFDVLDHNSQPPAEAEASTPPSPPTPDRSKEMASATRRPTLASAIAYTKDRQGLHNSKIPTARFTKFPMASFLLVVVSFVIARHVLIYPVVGLVTAALVPKINAPRLSQPDVSLLGWLSATNPMLSGAMFVATVQVWFVVFSVLRDAYNNTVALWDSAKLTVVVVSRLALLMGRTNTPLFRPLRHGYCDGVYDLCHAGHKRVIERASGCCDRLFAGAMCDEDCVGYKRQPIMSTAERAEEVARCYGVYRCLPASPPKGLPVALLAYYGITQVIYGEEYHRETDIYFTSARDLKIGITAPRTESISTSDLIRRIGKAV